MDREAVRSTALRVAALALLLLLALAGVLSSRTMSRVPDATVYFVTQEGGVATLGGTPRRLGTRELVDYADAAVRALAEGPTAAEASRGLASAVPAGTSVRSVSWADGTMTVDLDATFATGGGTTSMIARLEQVRWTLTQPSRVDTLHLFIDGEPLTVLGGEGLWVDNPWTRPASSLLPRW